MSLRKPPIRTPAFLAACRANARKSRGPRTPEGKARSRLNSLRHGRYCRKLHRLLPEGLSFHHQFLFRWIHHAIENCFRPATPRDRERARKLAVAVWCQVTARGGKRLMHLGIFLKTGEFEKKALLSPRRVRIRGRNPKQLLTFWTQTEGRRPLLKPGERRWQEPLVRAVWCGGRLAADWVLEPSPDPERDSVWRYYWQRYSKRQYRAFRRAQAREARQARARRPFAVDLRPVAAAEACPGTSGPVVSAGASSPCLLPVTRQPVVSLEASHMSDPGPEAGSTTRGIDEGTAMVAASYGDRGLVGCRNRGAAGAGR